LAISLKAVVPLSGYFRSPVTVRELLSVSSASEAGWKFGDQIAETRMRFLHHGQWLIKHGRLVELSSFCDFAPTARMTCRHGVISLNLWFQDMPASRKRM
jgi:hypothetical protein